MPFVLIALLGLGALYLVANKASKFPQSSPGPQPAPGGLQVIRIGPNDIHGGESISANVGDSLALIGIGDPWSQANPTGYQIAASPGTIYDTGGGALMLIGPGEVHISWTGPMQQGTDDVFVAVVGKAME